MSIDPTAQLQHRRTMGPIVFFQHSDFTGGPSMRRFAEMLRSAFAAKGYAVQAWKPDDTVHRRFAGTRWAKWAGYVDQFVLFPREVRRGLASQPDDTLFVFCDQALGPWISLVKDRPHVVHCLDLLALRSALGHFPENRTGPTGRLYQRWIRAGFERARHFISISEHTRDELRHHTRTQPITSEVVYCSLAPTFAPQDPATARRLLQDLRIDVPGDGYLLHVGSDAWYKNREGVVSLYARYVDRCIASGRSPLELWMVGPPPDAALRSLIAAAGPRARVRFLAGFSDQALAAAYSLAQCLIFPSLAEGFGWPPAEAMACGCPVVTTSEAPMTEVALDAATYLPRMPFGGVESWARDAVDVLESVLAEPASVRQSRRERGFAAIRRFDGDLTVDAIETLYRRVLDIERDRSYPVTGRTGVARSA